MNQPMNKAILRIGYTFSSLRCALVFCRWYSVHWILFGEEKAGVYFVYLYSYYEFHIFVSLYFTFCSFVVGTVCHVHRVARKGGRRGYTTCSREGRAPATHTRIHQYNPVQPILGSHSDNSAFELFTQRASASVFELKTLLIIPRVLQNIGTFGVVSPLPKTAMTLQCF